MSVSSHSGNTRYGFNTVDLRLARFPSEEHKPSSAHTWSGCSSCMRSLMISEPYSSTKASHYQESLEFVKARLIWDKNKMGQDNLPQILLSMGARNTLFLRQPRFLPVIRTEQILLQVTLRLLIGNVVQVAGFFTEVCIC